MTYWGLVAVVNRSQEDSMTRRSGSPTKQTR